MTLDPPRAAGDPGLADAAGRDATHFLRRWRGGDAAALERLTPLVYASLRERARGYLRRERKDHSLQATELVHEVFLRLVDVDVSWQDRAHFLAVAAGAMRRILVDHARARSRDKRGGERSVLRLTADRLAADGGGAPEEDLIALDSALDALAANDPAKARLVELSFFGGLTVREIAEAVGASKSGVQRDLAFSRAWLRRRLGA
ncbi:MAG: ECF-type sigma factor [Acidobacteriota bacterium]